MNDHVDFTPHLFLVGETLLLWSAERQIRSTLERGSEYLMIQEKQ